MFVEKATKTTIEVENAQQKVEPSLSWLYSLAEHNKRNMAMANKLYSKLHPPPTLHVDEEHLLKVREDIFVFFFPAFNHGCGELQNI